MLLSGHPAFRREVDLPPAPHDALDMRGRPRSPDRQEPFFRLRRGHTSQRSYLGVGEGPSEERVDKYYSVDRIVPQRGSAPITSSVSIDR